MLQPLRVLIVEDNPHDAELVMRGLRRAGYEPDWRRVESEPAYLAALNPHLDLVISDYAMPQFSGLRALELLNQRGLDVPFILVSATIGEETAVAAMKQGAADYLLKDRMTRLGTAVEHALEQCRLRRERRKAEELVRESAASMAAAQEVGHFGSWELDLTTLPEIDRNPLRWSAQCYRIFGLTPGEVPVTNDLFFSFVHPDDREAIRTAVGAALETKQAYFLEHRIVLRSGEVRYVREAGRVFVDPVTQRPFKIVGTVHDITEERRADAAMREAHAQLYHLVARSPTVIYQLKLTGTAIRPHFISENIALLLGFSVEESLEPRWWRSHVHPEDQAIAAMSLQQALDEGASRVEYRIRHRNDSYVWLEDRKRRLSGATEEPREIVGGWTDVTARKLAEEAARETEARFRQVVENIHEVFWMIESESHRVLYVSPGYEAVWGRAAATLYAGAFKWLETVHPEDRARMHEAATTKQALGTYDETYRIVRPDGAVRWVRDRAYPVKGPDGAVRRVVGVAEDVTTARDMETKFLRAQRLEAIGTLSGGIAHDLNNILAPMLMATGLLRLEMSDARSREWLMLIESGTQRGANIIRQLLTFSRGIEGDRVAVQLRHVIKEMAEIARETFPRNITLLEDAARDLWLVAADATQLHQVLMNLCVNARDAMPTGGTLTLRAENVQVDTTLLPAHPDAKAGAYVRLTVSDTGQGIPAQIIDRIFDPFFTTKEIGKGTGLGLSTVLGIVKSHDGFVLVNSTPGAGTAFQIYLPLAEGIAAAVETAPVVAPTRGRGELIMVVDDEESIRLVTRGTLEQWNYRVVLAAQGAAGLALFHKHVAEVRLAVVD